MPGDRLPPIEGGLNVTEKLDTLEATGVVSLAKEAEREGLSVADQVTLQDANLREWMASRVVPAFLWANGLTLGAIGMLAVLDEINITLHVIAPSERIITHQVVMTLLGATTVQVGAIAALIARYLFPGRPGGG